MIDFFELWEGALKIRPDLKLNINYNISDDYSIIIRVDELDDHNKKIIEIQNCTYQETFARAYVALCDWLANNSLYFKPR